MHKNKGNQAFWPLDKLGTLKGVRPLLTHKANRFGLVASRPTTIYLDFSVVDQLFLLSYPYNNFGQDEF
jgi:hypothetical protein